MIDYISLVSFEPLSVLISTPAIRTSFSRFWKTIRTLFEMHCKIETHLNIRPLSSSSTKLWKALRNSFVFLIIFRLTFVFLWLENCTNRLFCLTYIIYELKMFNILFSAHLYHVCRWLAQFSYIISIHSDLHLFEIM